VRKIPFLKELSLVEGIVFLAQPYNTTPTSPFGGLMNTMITPADIEAAEKKWQDSTQTQTGICM
jgi:hypothetical protein